MTVTKAFKQTLKEFAAELDTSVTRLLADAVMAQHPKFRNRVRKLMQEKQKDELTS